MMKVNPYSKLLEITKSQNKARDNVLIGEVVSSSPLTISAGELQIDKDNILVADYLQNNYSRKYSTDRTIPNVGSTGTMTYTDGVQVGDRLAMLQTADRQIYIIIARVEGV